MWNVMWLDPVDMLCKTSGFIPEDFWTTPSY